MGCTVSVEAQEEHECSSDRKGSLGPTTPKHESKPSKGAHTPKFGSKRSTSSKCSPKRKSERKPKDKKAAIGDASDAVSTASSGSSEDYNSYRSTLGPPGSTSGSFRSAAAAADAQASSSNEESGDVLREFTAAELRRATWNFSKKLGEGGFGVVYRGRIAGDGEKGGEVAVAVKVMKQDSCQGFKEWQAELRFLGELKHPNLVRLYGYCYEGDDWMLVYEFIPNSSFEHHLFHRRNEPVLGFAERVKVLLGAAEGMVYLHGGCGQHIIYRDLKTSNILVDHDFNARLSDFGLAREGPDAEKTHVSTDIVGTSGYLAPEYMERGHASERCDVFSFGVVMLEVITGRRASSYPEDRLPMVEWAVKKAKSSPDGWKDILDPSLKNQYSEKAVRLIAAAARSCVMDDPHRRPTMVKVVEALKVANKHCVKEMGGKGGAAKIVSSVKRVVPSAKGGKEQEEERK